MKKIELLAPAGNMECLKQAINNGADAVYLGGINFSARAFAGNFNNDEIKQAVNYAHLRNVKIYVTINTLLNEYELENALKQAKYYYDIHVDALLVQDLGLFYRIKQELPDFELHASTQMHIHNLQGIKNAKELGFKRVVVARETSLEMLKEFCKEDIEIECFVHGAICVSYSGECLMSSLINNRSANRGMCAQCCRLKYEIYDLDNNKVVTDTDYLLSPKDMYLLDNIEDLINANVSSLKIEGRMKSAAYVGYVTKIYRNAIDAYYQSQKYKLNEKDMHNLKVLFNRDFTNTYLLNDNHDLFSNNRPNHMGVPVGKVVDIKNKKIFIKLNEPLNQFDGIRILNKKDDYGLILNKLEVNGLLKANANTNEIITINCEDNHHIELNDIVVKTQDYKLEKELSDYKLKLIDLELNFTLKIDKEFEIDAKFGDYSFKYINEIKCQKSINHPITKENIIKQYNKIDDHPYKIKDIYFNEFEEIFLSLKTINDIRRDFYNKLDEFRLNLFKRDIQNNPLYLNDIKDISNEYDNINNFDYLDVVNINSNYPDNNIIVNEFGGLLLNKNKIAGFTMNIYNSYALEFLLRLGFKNAILSLELNEDTLYNLIDAFNKRNCMSFKPYVFSEGNRPLMYLNRNPFEKYINLNNISYISNGYSSFLVRKHHNYVVIYEKKPFKANFSSNQRYLLYKHKII